MSCRLQTWCSSGESVRSARQKSVAINPAETMPHRITPDLPPTNNKFWFTTITSMCAKIFQDRDESKRLKARHHDHITLVLTTIHWLAVCNSVMFKTNVGVEVSWQWHCPRLAPKLCIEVYSCCFCFRSSASQVSLDGLTDISRAEPWQLRSLAGPLADTP